MRNLIKLLVAVLAAACLSGGLVAPAGAVSSTSTHLDGQTYAVLQPGQGVNPNQSCDDWGGPTNATPYAYPCNDLHRESGAPTEPALTQGMSSNMVGFMQWALAALGYYLAPCAPDGRNIDGVFGSQTAIAVSFFNAAQGLSGGSVFNNQSWRRLATFMFPVSSYYSTFFGSVFSMVLIHDNTPSAGTTNFIIVPPNDESHGTNWNALDANYGPNNC